MPKSNKHVDDMTGSEQIRYWIDIVSGQYDLTEYELDTLSESVDREKLTITLQKRKSD
jgi:hypothetical protein